MKGLKRIFRNYMLLSAVCIIFGVALVAKPEFFTHAISYTIGGISIAVGAVHIIRFLVAGENRNAFFYALFRGIVLCAIGIFLIVKPDFIFKIIAVAFGIYMLFNGIVNLGDSFEIKRNDGNWIPLCVLSSLTALLGILILLNPLMTVSFAGKLLGIVLVASGVTNIISGMGGKHQLKVIGKKLKKATNADENEQDVIDV